MIHHPIFRNFKQYTGKVEPGFQVDFLGVMTRNSFIAGLVAALGLELPKNEYVESASSPAFNEEYFEWIDLLETVMAADKEFVMIELGAGYGRWLVDAAMAVKQYHGNIPLKLIGVEAEPSHFQWMKQHFQDNGIDPEQQELIEAVVDEKEGEVDFYVGRPDEWYGQSIARGSNSSSESVTKIKAITLNKILSKLEQVDLIDLDVQGAELAVLRSGIEELNKKVKRVHIGTHGLYLEQGLRELFREHEWYKVNDYCCNAREITEWGEISFQDGVQTWINPRLSPVQPTEVELNRLQAIIRVMENSKFELVSELEKIQSEREQLQQTQAQLEQEQETITAMSSSKFWKLRTAWFKLKRAMGLPTD